MSVSVTLAKKSDITNGTLHACAASGDKVRNEAAWPCPTQDAEAAAAAAEQRCSELRATQAAMQADVDALSDAKVQARLFPSLAHGHACTLVSMLVVTCARQ